MPSLPDLTAWLSQGLPALPKGSGSEGSSPSLAILPPHNQGLHVKQKGGLTEGRALKRRCEEDLGHRQGCWYCAIFSLPGEVG